MQSTLPLFNELYVVTDAEFATIATLSGVAGAGAVAAAGGGIWWSLAAAGATAGPIGVATLGGVFALSFGIAAIVEGVKWGNKQDTNRTYRHFYPASSDSQPYSFCGAYQDTKEPARVRALHSRSHCSRSRKRQKLGVHRDAQRPEGPIEERKLQERSLLKRIL
jgi:hypothetical protein